MSARRKISQAELDAEIAMHVLWLADRTKGKRLVMRGADLRGADLRGAILRDADMRDADLRGAIMSGADMRDADMRGADMRGAIMSDADMSDADMSDADLSGAILRDADMRGADMRWADLRDAIMRGAIGYIVGPQHSDGYRIDVAQCDSGGWRVIANRLTPMRLTLPQYRERAEGYRDAAKRSETLAIIAYLEARIAQMEAGE
jgi:uncharacterized protein YjbI with pentapeptide repeats